MPYFRATRRLQASCSDSRGLSAYRQQASSLEACRAGLGKRQSSSWKALKSPDVPLLDPQQPSPNLITPRLVVESGFKQQLVQQRSIWPAGRRALLVAVALSPLLGFYSPAYAQAAGSSDGSSSSGAEISSTSEPGSGQQQGADSAEAGQVADGASGTAAQAEGDDSPSENIDDDDSSSSSGSDSSSDSDSDSDSSSDEEPGELFASSDDNNAAGGSSSNGASAGSNGSTDRADSSDQARSSSGGANSDAATTASPKSANRTAMGSNLSVPSYIQILQDSRRSSWPMLAQKIQTSEWIELSQLLVQAPFDAVRQACFYIPWALLQCDDFEAAIAARKAYLDYIDHVHALAAIALKAADGVPGADVQVQQAFTLMNASLTAFLSAVPVKYQRYRI